MSNKTLTLYKFDGFCLDTEQKCLWYENELVSLTPKAYQTLSVLLKHRGEILDKEFLLNEVWTDTFVEESTLAQNILTLRKTLALFKKEKEFIVTVPRRGYRFVAEVSEVFGDEEVIVIKKQTQTHIVAEQNLIHDSAENQIAEPSRISRTKSIGQYLTGKNILIYGLVGILLLSGGFFAFRQYLQKPRFSETKFQQFQVNTLVSSADIKNAFFSPDEKYLAFIEQKNGLQSLSVRQIEKGNVIEIVPKINGRFIGATFSPDSEEIFYSVYERRQPLTPFTGSLYKVPLLGGASEKISDDVDSPPAVSPDKKRIAFIRQTLETKETGLIIADIDGKNEKVLATRKFEESFTTAGLDWSPDGKLISVTANVRKNNSKSIQIAVVNVDSGELKIVTNQDWLWAGKTSWLQDGSGFAVVTYGAKSPNLNDEIWIVSYPEGKPRSLTNGINGILGIGLSKDSNSTVAVKSNKITDFFVASLEDLTQSKQILTKTGDDSLLPLGADWTTDGKIIYSATQNGNADIWTINSDGAQKQITSDTSVEFLPRASKDGRFLIFLSNRSGKMDVWRTDAEGTNPKQLSDNENVSDAIISPDGNNIFFIAKSSENEVQTLWKVSINGENKTQLTNQITSSPKISPDGKNIACYFPNDETKRMSPTLISSEDGKIIRYFTMPKSESVPLFDWSHDGQNLLLIAKQNNSYGLWQQSLTSNEALLLKDLGNNPVFRFAVSKDGNRLFYEQGIGTNNVILIRNLTE